MEYILAEIVNFREIAGLWLVLIILCGVFCLWKGADWLTTGSGNLAIIHDINPIIVGITILAVATSMPEFVTTLISAGKGSDDLAMGNIIGSNICNIGLVLGMAVMIQPIEVKHQLVRREIPLLLVATAIFCYLCIGGIAQLEGFGMVLGLAIYLTLLIRRARGGKDIGTADLTEEMGGRIDSSQKCIVLILIGSVVLSLGAYMLVSSAEVLAERLGVSQIVIAITVLALGTSLPELAASVVAAAKKQNDLCAGNIVGSNLFNMLLIGGGVSCIFPISVDENLFKIEIPAMILLTIALWLVFAIGRTVTRLEGILLLLAYAGIILVSSVSQQKLL